MNMTNPKHLSAILALAGALAGALVAAPAMASTERGGMRGAILPVLDFADIDADGDGAITLEEWRSHLSARSENWRAGRLDTRVGRLMEGDADGDGLLSAEELAAHLQALAEERLETGQRARGERHGWGHHEGREAGRHHGRHGMRGEGSVPGRGAMMEAGPDERVVRSFQRIDRDGDGRITEAEFDAFAGRMQERMERRAEQMERRLELRGEGRGRD